MDAKLLGGGKLGLDLQEWRWCSACLFTVFAFIFFDYFRLFEGLLSGSEPLSKQFSDLLETDIINKDLTRNLVLPCLRIMNV